MCHMRFLLLKNEEICIAEGMPSVWKAAILWKKNKYGDNYTLFIGAGSQNGNLVIFPSSTYFWLVSRGSGIADFLQDDKCIY